ncbi:hypothetical protein, partial [Pseudomonas sp. Sample_22]|uniref:hypothetical protein n=1 Tax=Pseudomonas sp. Sample_22 TaxID=2448266 RepID=UPI0019D596D8
MVENPDHTGILCGSWLASDGGLSTNLPKPIVGVSLLAMAASHSTGVLTDPPLSRASFAPTEDLHWSKIPI